MDSTTQRKTAACRARAKGTANKARRDIHKQDRNHQNQEEQAETGAGVQAQRAWYSREEEAARLARFCLAFLLSSRFFL